MANLKETERLRAEELYFTTNWTQANIARNVGVNERTISVWAAEGNWKAIKKARFHSPMVEAHQMFEELRVISANISKRSPSQRFASREETEIRTKTIALINMLETVKGQWRNIPQDYDLSIPQELQQDQNLQQNQEQNPGQQRNRDDSQDEQQAKRA